VSEAKSGQIPVVVSILGILLVSAASLALDPDIPGAVRTVLTIGLGWALYNGMNWARWVFLVLLLLATAFVLFVVFSNALPTVLVAVLVGVLLVYYGCLALLFIPSLGGQYFQTRAT